MRKPCMNCKTKQILALVLAGVGLAILLCCLPLWAFFCVGALVLIGAAIWIWKAN